MKNRKQGLLQSKPHHCEHASTQAASGHDDPSLLLMTIVQQVLTENHRLRNDYVRLLRQTKQALAKIMELKDAYTFGHSMRVMQYSLLIGRTYGLNKESLEALELSALFHDIGKIGVPDCVLLKPDRLTPDEQKQMQKHPKFSAEVLDLIDEFRPALEGALHHHERYDGSGYPGKLKGAEIPLFSRIILVADAFDAMTSTRPYRKALPLQVAYSELRRHSGVQFDPEIVAIFFQAHENLTLPDTSYDNEELEQQPSRKAA